MLAVFMFSKKIENQLQKQSYVSKQKIAGVEIVDLKEFSDDGGSFVEIGRLGKGLLKAFPDFEVKQMNYSTILPGAVKATHIHKVQEDVWFVLPSSRILVGLQDLREGSKTEGVKMRFVLGAGKAQLLLIPRGVAHGLANLSSAPANMIYFVNRYFSADEKNCDEYRLPADFFGEDFWEMTKG